MAHALSQKRLGGICCINMCGFGETLLPPEMPSIIKAILGEGHYVMIVSNMVLSKRIDEILTASKEYLERLFFKCSFHYTELKRLGLLECFAANVQKIRQASCSFTVEITPHDELLPHLEEVKSFALDHFGALPHVTVARDEAKRNKELPILTKLSKLEYENTWKGFSSDLFEFKYDIWSKKITDFCYAGQWSFTLNLCNGETEQCYKSNKLQNIFENPTAPLVESPVCTRCREPHCFNGHAFLTFGLVPSMKTPTYADMRDRVCQDSSHWLTPRMRAFFSQRLYDNNPQYSQEEKKCLCQYPPFILTFVKKACRAVKRPLRQLRKFAKIIAQKYQN